MNNILIFGDSITAGRGVKKVKNWTSKLSSVFDAKNTYETIIYNLAIPGETSKDLIQRINFECQTRTKKLTNNDAISIVIAIGINDSRNIGTHDELNTPLDVFRQNIETLIDIAHKFTNDLIFIGPTPVIENKMSLGEHLYFLNKNIAEYNKNIKEICNTRRVNFIDITDGWLNFDYEKLLAEDGIHLNELGHEKIFEKILPFIDKNFSSFDSFQILKQELSLSDNDIKILQSKFSDKRFCINSLLLGQSFDEIPEIIFAGICLRKDIDEICLSTVYQILMPIKIASYLKIPAVIILPIKEESFLQTKFASEYTALGEKLEKGIKNIAKDLGNIKVQVINTSTMEGNDKIKKTLEKLRIVLPEIESRYLFTISEIKPSKIVHFRKRILADKRSIAGHSFYFMNQISGLNKFLLVEDINQSNCPIYARRFEQSKHVNFLALLSLPNMSGNKPMFNSEKDERLLLGMDENYYRNAWNKSSESVRNLYLETLKLLDSHETKIYNFEYFLKNMKKVSNYF